MGATYVGITGTIGSGKSTFLGIINSWINSPDEERRLKGMVLSADEIAKELLYRSSGKYDKGLTEILGTEILTHNAAAGKFGYDFKLIRDIITNPENRAVKERFWKFTADLVWPEIVRRASDFDGFIYVESALIHEVGWNDGRFKHIVCIWCKDETASARLQDDIKTNVRQLDAYALEGLRSVQLPASEKRCRSDFSLYNSHETRREELPEYLRHLIAFWDPTVFKTRPPYCV